MPDENAGKQEQQNSGATGSETDSKKTDNQQTQAIDVSKLGDEDFAKVFEDPRLWNHPRFKSLAEKGKKLTEYETAEAARKQEELKKNGEFEKLAKNKEEEANQWKGKYTQSLADNKIQAEAVKLGAVDLEAVLKLIDRSTVKTNDDGSITGAAEAVKALLDSKPYLKGDPLKVTVGGGTAPGAEGTAGLKRFKLSQIQDAQFYRENEKDIMLAIKNKLVENDLAQ